MNFRSILPIRTLLGNAEQMKIPTVHYENIFLKTKIWRNTILKKLGNSSTNEIQDHENAWAGKRHMKSSLIKCCA
ncbi:hypothetical protein DFP96_111117 [Listeria rocourtiae]|uniref:Uncharacterized protein n=1 Tax=Listeria rocourtiae TaxID=647910 RepID=A0A4R6ZHV6_9LIST|nr:hypothetical protein PROCOU_16699 [Listeria rocourtiae FSL F6-920]TDR51808.1 hypothetical protein DFP96_111117 [Listeria rocourtiae]